MKLALFACVNNARIRSWNRPVLSSEVKVSDSRNQRKPLLELELTTDRHRPITSQTRYQLRHATPNYTKNYLVINPRYTKNSKMSNWYILKQWVLLTWNTIVLKDDICCIGRIKATDTWRVDPIPDNRYILTDVFTVASQEITYVPNVLPKTVVLVVPTAELLIGVNTDMVFCWTSSNT